MRTVPHHKSSQNVPPKRGIHTFSKVNVRSFRTISETITKWIQDWNFKIAAYVIQLTPQEKLRIILGFFLIVASLVLFELTLELQASNEILRLKIEGLSNRQQANLLLIEELKEKLALSKPFPTTDSIVDSTPLDPSFFQKHKETICIVGGVAIGAISIFTCCWLLGIYPFSFFPGDPGDPSDLPASKLENLRENAHIMELNTKSLMGSLYEEVIRPHCNAEFKEISKNVENLYEDVRNYQDHVEDLITKVDYSLDLIKKDTDYIDHFVRKKINEEN